MVIFSVCNAIDSLFSECDSFGKSEKGDGFNLCSMLRWSNRNRGQKSSEPNENYELKNASAFNLEEADEQFDVLINNYMFDLIPFDQMDAVLAEFKRVLKKRGKLVLVNMTPGEKFGSGIYDLIYRVSPKLMGGCRAIRLSEKLKAHGFQVKLHEYHQECMFPSEVILARK